MDKKSLFIGMSLGATIALGGMVLGGQGRNANGVFDTLTVRELKAEKIHAEQLTISDIAYIARLNSQQFYVVNKGNRILVSLREATNLGIMTFYDEHDEEIVRVSGVLKGGGRIATMLHGKTSCEILAGTQGGRITVHGTSKDSHSAVRLVASDKTGEIVAQDGNGATTIQLGRPESVAETTDDVTTPQQ